MNDFERKRDRHIYIYIYIYIYIKREVGRKRGGKERRSITIEKYKATSNNMLKKI